MTLSTALALIAVALSGHRLAILVASDDLTAPLRDWIDARAYFGPRIPVSEPTDEEYNATLIRSRFWAFVLEGWTCEFCVGVWSVAGSWWAWFGWGQWGRWLVMLCAAMGLQAYLASRS